jgi:hypothetical protein
LVGCCFGVGGVQNGRSRPTPTPETIAIAPTNTATLAPPTPTLPVFTHAMFVESVAEGFEMLEVEKPFDFIMEEAVDPNKKYRAMEVCNIYCDILVEELISGKVYRLAAPSLPRHRFFANSA